MTSGHSDIQAETLIPHILRNHPQLRSVLDRYGLKGCGGPEGPYETLRFFCRAHDVDERDLLAELDAELAKAPETTVMSEEHGNSDVADTIYRRYFLAGILVILTFGATWGAWLLWRIGFDGSFTGVSVNEVNAHGQAQVFGWMGLFMMGFAYQAFPRFWHTSLVKPTLAVGAFVLMLSGVVAASIGTALTGHWAGSLFCAEFGSLLEFAAVTTFALQIFATWRQSGKKLEPYIGFILTALIWFVVSTAFNAWHTWNTVSAITTKQLLFWVATYQAPLRDMQFHGLAIAMILGVSLRTLPHLFGLPRVSNKRAWSALTLLTSGVVGEVALFITYRLTHNHLFAALLMVPWLMLIAGSLLLVLPFKLWKPFPEADRSSKFIRAGFAWLFISLLMLLFLPVYQCFSHIPFSHAYYGAIRHAITVGFISLMIMGYAAKVVPTLNGIAPSKLSQLWAPFVLVNVGCFLRVTTQPLTDWSHSIFPFIGISGTLEVIGLGWWGFELAKVIFAGMKHDLTSIDGEMASDSVRPQQIMPEHVVADVLAWYPQTEPTFVLFGFSHVLNPLMRRTLARQVTLAQACRMHGVSLEEFVLSINSAIDDKSAYWDRS